MDILKNIQGSLIQHGFHNNRIYLMRLNTEDLEGLIARLDQIAGKNGYGKIFAKIPAPAWNPFKSAGYIKEAVVPGFFEGKIDGFFLGKYFPEDRPGPPDVEKQTGSTPCVPTPCVPTPCVPTGSENKRIHNDAFSPAIVSCGASDTGEMSAIYRQIFATYPFPIQEAAYLKRMMKEGVLYYCVRIEDRIAALAAAEMDFSHQNVEMTDFATLPQWRWMGLAGRLLGHMNREMRKLGIKTAYTIARAASRGINCIFNNNGYHSAGVLKKNSQICGSIQDMTVWYKHL